MGRVGESSVEPGALLHCGCKLYHLRDQTVAAAQQVEKRAGGLPCVSSECMNDAASLPG